MATHFPVSLLHIFLLSIIIGGGFQALADRKELRTEEANEDEMILKGDRISQITDPSQVIQLSWQPRVFLYRSFLSDEECDHLISLAHGKGSNGALGHDLIKVHLSGGFTLDTDDAVVRKIEQKISGWTFFPNEYSASLRVQHFLDEDSKQNYSYSGSKSVEEKDKLLLATVILYLSRVNIGGQIIFPDSASKMWSDCTEGNNIVRPSKGNAIVVFNTHLNATIDKSSIHARCPVLDGDMWCATKFFHIKGVSVSREKDLSQSENADCTDEDENCPQWAAIGECQRNSVFMVGSPDYYGTCRKSCNAC